MSNDYDYRYDDSGRLYKIDGNGKFIKYVESTEEDSDNEWITLDENDSSSRNPIFASIVCPTCGFIVHVFRVEYPAKVTPGGGSGPEVIIWLSCEHGHRHAIEIEDHSGQMRLCLRTVDEKDYYHTYLASPGWRAKAEAAKERAGYRCQVCNRPREQVTLAAHHRTYQRLGHELDGDLTVLCQDCHQIFHDNGRLAR